MNTGAYTMVGVTVVESSAHPGRIAEDRREDEAGKAAPPLVRKSAGGRQPLHQGAQRDGGETVHRAHRPGRTIAARNREFQTLESHHQVR